MLSSRSKSESNAAIRMTCVIKRGLEHMREPEGTGAQSFTPGEHVTVVGPVAQAAVGGDHGIVVGSTGDLDNGTGKVVVALDMPPVGSIANAVITPADLESDAAVK